MLDQDSQPGRKTQTSPGRDSDPRQQFLSNKCQNQAGVSLQDLAQYKLSNTHSTVADISRQKLAAQDDDELVLDLQVTDSLR